MDNEKKQLINNEVTEHKEIEEEGTNNEIKETKKEEEYDPDRGGAGPIKDRSCTDVLCLGLLIAFLVLWVMIAAWGMTHGDPSKLMYPTDSYGNICGKGEFSEKPFLMFFDLTKCISLTAIAGCPTPQVSLTSTTSSLAPNVIILKLINKEFLIFLYLSFALFSSL